MHFVDVLALLLLAIAVTAFGLGGIALARTEDLKALYWLAIGVVTVRAAVQVARPGRVG
jgi:hypothetical protein